MDFHEILQHWPKLSFEVKLLSGRLRSSDIYFTIHVNIYITSIRIAKLLRLKKSILIIIKPITDLCSDRK